MCKAQNGGQQKPRAGTWVSFFDRTALIDSVLMDDDLTIVVLASLQVLDYLQLACVCRLWRQLANQALTAWRAHYGFVVPSRPEFISAPLHSRMKQYLNSTVSLAVLSPSDALNAAVIPCEFPTCASYPGQRRCDEDVTSSGNCRPAAELGVRICGFKHQLGNEPDEDTSTYDEDTTSAVYYPETVIAPGCCGALFDSDI